MGMLTETSIAKLTRTSNARLEELVAEQRRTNELLTALLARLDGNPAVPLR